MEASNRIDYCAFCGIVDDIYDESSQAMHDASPKHMFNIILCKYTKNKGDFKKAKDGIEVKCSVLDIVKSDAFKLRVKAKPGESVMFKFLIENTSRHDVVIIGIELGHPQPQFTMNNHEMRFGCDTPYVLNAKTIVPIDVFVTFTVGDTGLYEMPIFFAFKNATIKQEPIAIIVREMLINVDYNHINDTYIKSPYTFKDWKKGEKMFHSIQKTPPANDFAIPKMLKTIFAVSMDEEMLALRKLGEQHDAYREVLNATKNIVDEGLTRSNYIFFWHHVLWWEEVSCRINLRKYNMEGVTMCQNDDIYDLEVPGLAEKRPSLLRGDKVYARFTDNMQFIFEGVIKNVEENTINICGFAPEFHDWYTPRKTFNVRFMMSRIPLERMHIAVHKLFESKHSERVFPEPNKRIPHLQGIRRFYNPLIKDNPEQALAVRHIVSGTSGKAPYMVFGPPGTGKTMTIVEAILQLIMKNPKNRIMVCTNSNMAADHVACQLMKFNDLMEKSHTNHFLFRASSENRVWETLPPILEPVSNGKDRMSFYSVKSLDLAKYKVVIVTLQHSAKFDDKFKALKITHLFIDEAAQALEAGCLIPITSLLQPAGHLILAGDPKQLGPVCMSKQASGQGLGISLMERLYTQYTNLYQNDPNYITILKKNFRSHPDILKLSNQMFYDNCLEPAAPLDLLSLTKILPNEEGGASAVVFHAINSKEQKVGKSPSYYNEKELSVLKRYVHELVHTHKVQQEDIGIISPYARQVHKTKYWLTAENLDAIEVGTVEAFQGKEKRVILVSTVRANNTLLDYDEKYKLGFLVDRKRFNVTLTRAKAKIIIVGNPTCLTRDSMWRLYMENCMASNSYLNQESQQLERTTELLRQVAVTNFNRFRVIDYLNYTEDSQELIKMKKMPYRTLNV